MRLFFLAFICIFVGLLSSCGDVNFAPGKAYMDTNAMELPEARPGRASANAA